MKMVLFTVRQEVPSCLTLNVYGEEEFCILYHCEITFSVD